MYYWSNWHDVRLYTDHVRYIEPVIYEVSSCNEHLRVKNTYNLFSKPDIYNFNQIKNDPKTYHKNFYFNNLLPGESLIFIFDARLNVTNTDVIFFIIILINMIKKILIIKSLKILDLALKILVFKN